MSYRIEELNSDDLDRVFDLTVEAGLTSRQMKQSWIATQPWLLEGSKVNTGMTPPLGHVMFKAEELVCFVGYSQRMFKSDGGISPAIVLSDLVVHPDHRGMAGIMLCKHLLRFFESAPENWKIVGLHHSRDAAALWHALGSKAVPNTGLTFTATVSSAKFLSLRLPHLRFLLPIIQALGCMPIVDALLTRAGKPVTAQGPLRMQPCEASNVLAPGTTDYSELLSAFQAVQKTGVVRDIAYLKWRYLDHPQRQFHWYELRSEGRVQAITIAHRGHDGAATLCELIVGPTDISASFEEILNAALFACAGDEAAIVRSKVVIPAAIQAFRAMVIMEDEKAYNQFWISPPPASVDDAVYTFGDNKLL